MLKLILILSLAFSNVSNNFAVRSEVLFDSGLIIVKDGKPTIDNAQYYSSKFFR